MVTMAPWLWNVVRQWFAWLAPALRIMHPTGRPAEVCIVEWVSRVATLRPIEITLTLTTGPKRALLCLTLWVMWVTALIDLMGQLFTVALLSSTMVLMCLQTVSVMLSILVCAGCGSPITEQSTRAVTTIGCPV